MWVWVLPSIGCRSPDWGVGDIHVGWIGGGEAQNPSRVRRASVWGRAQQGDRSLLHTVAGGGGGGGVLIKLNKYIIGLAKNSVRVPLEAITNELFGQPNTCIGISLASPCQRGTSDMEKERTRMNLVMAG